jgi:hypothetical protein
MAGTLQGFEFATPVDDISQVFNTSNNPGTVGLRFMHTPGWQQQFLITWMVINKQVWSAMTPAQQVLVQTVARDNLVSTYAENLRQQGAALKFILEINKKDGNPYNDMVMVEWPMRDQARLRDATIKFLNGRIDDAALPAGDRADYAKVLESLRLYVRASDRYWDHRDVKTGMRFEDWSNKLGECWEDHCDPQNLKSGHHP